MPGSTGHGGGGLSAAADPVKREHKHHEHILDLGTITTSWSYGTPHLGLGHNGRHLGIHIMEHTLESASLLSWNLSQNHHHKTHLKIIMKLILESSLS